MICLTMSQHKCVSFRDFRILQCSERLAAQQLQAQALQRSLTAKIF
jgi:hypothetical protein